MRYANLKKVAIFILLTTSSFVLGCSKEPRKLNRNKVKKIYMGDPRNVIEGTTLDPHSIFTTDFFRGDAEATVYGTVNFSSHVSYTVSTQRNIEEENAAAEGGETEPAISVSYYRENDTIMLQLPDYGFIIQNQKSGLGLKTMVTAKSAAKAFPVQLVHFSVDKGGNMASLLFFEDNTDFVPGTSLTAIYLVKKVNPNIPQVTDRQYFYLYGRGVPVGWQRYSNVTLTIPTRYYYDLYSAVSSASAKWNSAMGQGLHLTTNAAYEYPPFSDLNYNGVYILNDLLDDPDQSSFTAAVTYPIADLDTYELIDGDIFIMAKEFEKAGISWNSPSLTTYLHHLMLHEIGHFLGLDHQFTGVRSVMSYADQKEMDLTDYDIDAIQHIYNY